MKKWQKFSSKGWEIKIIHLTEAEHGEALYKDNIIDQVPKTLETIPGIYLTVAFNLFLIPQCQIL